MAKDANEEKKAPAKETKQEAPATKEGIATYNQDEPEMIKVVAAKGTQLYDPTTQTLYTDGEAKGDKATEARANDQFVVTNLKRGKLKKA